MFVYKGTNFSETTEDTWMKFETVITNNMNQHVGYFNPTKRNCPFWVGEKTLQTFDPHENMHVSVRCYSCGQVFKYCKRQDNIYKWG